MGAGNIAEQEELVQRLVARIAELEEKLYKAELEAPVVKPTVPDESTAAMKGGFLATIKETLTQAAEDNPILNQNARIVYNQAPPPEVAQQMSGSHATQSSGAHLGSTSSAPSSVGSWWRSLTKTSMPPGGVEAGCAPQQSGAKSKSSSKAASVQGESARQSIAGDEGFFQASALKQQAVELATDNCQTVGDAPSSSTVDSSLHAQGGDVPATPAILPITPVGAALTSTSVASTPGASMGTTREWFAHFFKRERPSHHFSQMDAHRVSDTFNERVADDDLVARQTMAQIGSYYRYNFDPVDVEAEMEVTARVRKAAAEALMEAQEKLRAAEKAQAAMQAQLVHAEELHKEVERLKIQNEEALAKRRALEDEMISSRAQLEALHQTQASLQQELDSMHTQAGIWKNANSDEQDKLKQENQLIRSQLQTRLNDLANTKTRLSDAEAEKQRLMRDIEDLSNKLQWLQRINSQLENSASQLEHYRKQASEFQDKFMRERAVRRRLHEQLQQLRGNIRVMCRVRPVQANQKDIISYPLEGLLAIQPPDRRGQEYEFDHVFGPDATQQMIYEEVSPMIRSCADGYNVCIFAYGQTGSGKTHTMEGPPNDPGINVRALEEFFAIATEEGCDNEWKISVSMMEIYNESVNDLLLPSSETAPRSLDVAGFAAGELPPGVERVPGLTWRSVTSTDQVKQILVEGWRNRATASTALNAHSSRSHALLSVRVTAKTPDGSSHSSTIHLVDLAGSERVDKSEVSGQQMKEAQSINKSLSALGDVISALQRRTSHIPFRNSKLTQVLQDALCGSSKVMLVCNISPEAVSSSETLSSLNFALRASQVELGQARKQLTQNMSASDRPQGSISASPSPAQTPVATPSGKPAKPVRPGQGVSSSATHSRNPSNSHVGH